MNPLLQIAYINLLTATNRVLGISSTHPNYQEARAQLRAAGDELEAEMLLLSSINQPETVKILKTDYDELLKDQEFLRALEAAGVDNWSGYSYAFELLEGDES